MKALFLLATALFATPVLAQHTSGTIHFEEKISIDVKGEDIPENLRAFMPKEQKSQKVLYFNSSQSLYENGKQAKEEESDEFEQGGVKIRMEHNKPDEKIFVAFGSRERVAQRDLMGRLFLVKDTVDTKKWKFTDRQKNILDMPCQEALYVHDADTVSAWYTTSIPVAGGPKDFMGLPGMILELHIGNNMSIKATAIDFAEDVSKKIKQPTKGKTVSDAAFEKMSKEKQEELMKQFGGKGNVIIRSTTIRN